MRIKIIFILGFVICFSVEGQYLKNEISINFNPGISLFYGHQYYDDFKSKLAFSLGATYNYYCSESALLQVGVLFEQKGAKVGVDFFDDNGNYYQTSSITFKRNYLIVPVVCSYVSKTRVRFYIGGGFFWGYLLSAEDLNSKVIINETFASKTQKFDFGINLGSGCFIPIHHRFSLDLGIKENLGLYNTLIKDLATKNNTISLQAGIKYKF
jgi:hypothetical protein